MSTTTQAAPDLTTSGKAPSFLKRWRELIVYTLLAAVFVIVGVFAPTAGEVYGPWSLLPPAVLFLFVLSTHRVIEGFLWGTLLAVFTFHHGNLLTGVTDGLFAQLTNPDNLWLIIVLLSIGALIGVLDHSGSSHAFGAWATRLARTSRAARIVSFAAPLALSNDAYLGTSTTGAAMTPVNERFGTPRPMTAYLVRSAAVPGSAFNPISTGSVFVAGLLVVNGYAVQGEELAAYVALIPFMFFPAATLLVALAVALGILRPLGAMRQAFAEPAQTEDADAGTTPEPRTTGVLYFFLPVLVLIVTAFTMGSIQPALFVTLAVTGLLYVARRVVTPEGYVEGALAGMRDMLPLAVIMATAFVLVDAISALGFTDYVISAIGGNISAAFLPVILFVLFGLTEFLVTLNWSLYLLAIPVVIPLSQQLGADPNLSIAALVCAGLWGVTACLTSDVGMLTAFSSRLSVYRHWITNLPYQLIAFVLAAAAFLVAGLVLAA